MNIEIKALKSSMIFALLISLLGVTFSILTDSKAILLDALFNFCYFIAAIFTIKVARLLTRPGDQKYPFGYGYFEVMINGVKGLMILSISILVFIDSVGALLKGGRTIEINSAIIYAVIATIMCFICTVILHRASKKTDSPLIKVDRLNWTINTIISSVVLLSFCSVIFLEKNNYGSIVSYVDPILVIAVIVVCIYFPFEMIVQSARELLNVAAPAEIQDSIHTIVSQVMSDYSETDIKMRLTKIGRKIVGPIDIAILNETRFNSLLELDELRAQIIEKVGQQYSNVELDIIFTGKN